MNVKRKIYRVPSLIYWEQYGHGCYRSFFITFIANNFTLCLAFQCFQASSSSSTCSTLKQIFIACELAFSIIYISLFIKCYKKISSIPSVVYSLPVHSAITNKTLSNLTRSHQSWSISTMINNRSNINEKIRVVSSIYASYNSTQKVCPKL
ncbi:unnamed protein product [Rotaria sp. Silwood2]|nr:unnamed protein product [Rotaria sp. Silwood2]CAF2521110.1 unnamed protein product [Rotaria sp. Silwood2]CAF2778663.1 unnamed protein product [Rotaria sp. Silwood2]CAF4081137.1 unnamed protein product [Rotaria sp. Silwood2]CAF4206446.1 unnamed protein product [Rotaria sp. Silwood2]